MENQEKINILIRLLKEDHISNEEFQMLYPEKTQDVFVPWNHTEEVLNPFEESMKQPFIHLVNPDWLPSYTEPNTGDWHTTPWFLNHDGTVTRSSLS